MVPRDVRAAYHAELALLAQLAALGTWLVQPSAGWAAAASVLAAVAAVFSPRSRRRGLVLLAVVGVAGAVVAVTTSRKVRAAEDRWPMVREDLIERASRQLDATLEGAVALARRLADRGAAMAAGSQADAFGALAEETRQVDVEAAVTVLDDDGRPWAWAGRHRLAVGRTAPAELYARMTPFYVVLEAHRQTAGGRVAVGQVLIAADSAVPDRDRTVAARFAAATGYRLEFLPPGRAPFESDVFDYCIPSCTPSAPNALARPDTLFSIRTSPPAQGAFKLGLIAAGGRVVAWIVAAGLAGLLLFGSRRARYGSLAVSALLLLLTNAGGALGLGGLFSPEVYYGEWLDPLTGSVGALLVTGGGLLIALVVLWPQRAVPAARWIAGGVGLLAPVAARFLAGGITTPAAGVRLPLWIAWEVALAMAATALVVMAAWAVAESRWRSRPWYAALAIGIAVAAGALGLNLWNPAGGWPWWYPALWIPAVALAAAAGPPLKQVISGSLVAGTAAALFTWGAVMDGRLSLAQADARRLGNAHDPVMLALLDRLGDDLAMGAAPRSPADLYRRWSRSALNRDGYPAVLATWSPDGQPVARLALADLSLSPALLRAEAMGAAARRQPLVEEFARVPGIHVVLAAPTADGSVVTVGVGPRSRLLRPFRVAQMLRREEGATPPYELSLSEPAAGDSREILNWRRDDRFIRGEEHLEVPGGPRHLHIAIDLGDPGGLLIRGALFLVLDLAVVLLLWGMAEAIAGRSALRERVAGMVRLTSYRLRLTVVLAVFFIVPTVGFAAWMGGRVQSDAALQRDLVTRQALRDATGTVAEQGVVPVRDLLSSIALHVGTDLLWYSNGVMTDASSPLLPDVGLVDPYLPPPVYRALLLNDALEVTADVPIAGRPTRVSYRAAGAGARAGVLASPRLADDTAPTGGADLAFALSLVTLLGVAAAAGLARVAARSLARPVGALRAAAHAVGRGEPLPPFGEAMPEEFASVSEAFARMAADVRASQAALEAARQRTVAVLRNVATGVLGLSRDLTVSVANPKAEELLGGALEAGGAVRDVTPKAWAMVWEWIEEILAAGDDLDSREFTVAGRRILAQVSTLGAEAGGCVVALDDITEVAHAARVLAWGELARQVAHEIKNPLTPLRLGVQHLQRAYRGAPGKFGGVLEQTSTQILAEIDRLDAVARAFARFGTPAVEQQAGPLELVNVVDVAKETAALYTLGGDTRMTVAEDGAKAVTALSRRDELKEVLVNLLENSRNAGATAVDLSPSGDGEGRVSLTVRDNGRGIPAAAMPRVFEPHFSTTTSGTGLGLAICKRLVESWGGVIEVESVEGQGTSVTITMVNQ